MPASGAEQGRSRLPALRGPDDLDEGVVALPGVPLQGGVLRLSGGVAGCGLWPYAWGVNPAFTELSVSPTAHTAAAVRAIRDARAQIPCQGSLCAALDLADPDGTLDQDAYREAVAALDVGARVFGHDAATDVGAHCDDAALVLDIAAYHLTGSGADVPAALEAFRRAAGPLLERTRTA